MRNGVVRIGLIAVAMVVAIAGRGCVTAPPPSAASLMAGDGATPAPTVPPAPPTPQTADERRAALDKQLSDSLGAFDAHVREEQQKTAQERDARQATVSATTTAAAAADASPAEATSGSSASPAPVGSHGGAQSARRESRDAHAGDLKSDKSASSNGSAGGNGATATLIPDGNDDDIVARRIRKAAELETDPELKDKLWKEYVEYKKNSQVR